MADLTEWSGNIDQFATKASETAQRVGMGHEGEPTIRIIRDYLQRELLGQTSKAGREIVFGYPNLLRYLAARVLLRDGWPLSKIVQHFDVSTQVELETLVPGLANKAVAALRSIRQEAVAAHAFIEPRASFSRRAARISGIEGEMREAMQRLGLPYQGVTTEQLTLLALTPWCQVLVQTDRLNRISIDEAEEIGRSLTASLLEIVTRKGGKR